MKKILQLLLIAIITIVSSCKKNEVTTTPDPIVPFDNAKTITTVVAGKVTAQDGTALNNVEITIGTSTTTTDANGNFIITKATLSEQAGLIKATKAGYFGGSRTLIAKEKVVNNVVIQLVKKTISGDFTNASGGTVTVATGGSVVFPANAVVTKSGAAYSGTVKVSAYFLDPTSSNCYKEMPGDLRGINASNNEQILTSYGMMAVELNGSNGEPLQLAAGKNATITFPIAATTQSAAPTTIPLWFFDETKGMWVEQGSATKTGNNYVGTVSHFTWWNCDWGSPLVNLTLRVVDQNGNPISSAYVRLTRNAGTSSWGNSSGGHTHSDGTISGAVPYNESFTIKVFNNYPSCQLISSTTNIGPFTQNTNYGDIIVNSVAANTITIKGTVVDCSNNSVANGYALIKFNNNYYYTNVFNGLFNKTIVSCSASPTGTATVDVFDLTTLKQNTTPATANITGSGTFNIGQIAACGVQNIVRYIAGFVDQNGATVNATMKVVFVGDSTQSYILQAPGGGLNIYLPANKIITRKVYVNTICSGFVLVDSTQIGPFSTDFNAGIINITLPQTNSFTISGTAKDCSNNPVNSGYAAAQIDGQNFSAPITNGNFIIPVTRCSTNTTTATVIVLDNITQQQNSTPITVSVSNTNVNVGNVQACGVNLSEFLNYTFNSTTYNLDSLQAYQQNLTYISGFKYNSAVGYTSFNGNFNGLVIGTYALNINLQTGNTAYNTSNNIPNATVTATITEYGVVGQYIAGTFTGNLLQSGTTLTKPISGSFRIKRTQ